MNIAFSVDTEPYPQPRPRVSRRRGVYEAKRVTEYKRILAIEGRRHMLDCPPFSTPVFVSIVLRRRFDITSVRFGDVDNHAKAVLDALKGVCYTDDSLVVGIDVIKVKSKISGVDIVISDLPPTVQ